MAIKARIQFYAYNDGKEIESVSGATFVNSFDEAEGRMLEFVQGRYSEAEQFSVLFNEKSQSIGAWIILARSDIDTNMYFLFIINRLQNA